MHLLRIFLLLLFILLQHISLSLFDRMIGSIYFAIDSFNFVVTSFMIVSFAYL